MSAGIRRIAICVTVVIGLCGFDPAIRIAHAQDTIPVLVRIEDRGRVGPRNRIVVRDPRTGVDREIYRSEHSEGHIPYGVNVSPDGRYLAFIEVVSQSGAGKRRLTIVERSGRIVRSLGESSFYAARGIREHLWCCGPDKLAIITGGLSREAVLGESTTLPNGISLVDVRSGAAMPIQGLRFPLQVYWAAFDSSLYIKDSPNAAPGARGPTVWPVYRYHVPTRALSRTTHQGVFFSPDGKYYFDTGVSEGWGSFQLYRTANDQDVTTHLSLPRPHLGPEGGWMPGADHVLVFIEKRAPRQPGPRERGDTTRRYRGRPQLMDRNVPQLYTDRWNLAVDAETGRVIDRFQGDLGAGWKTNAPLLPIERRTGIELLPARRP